MKRKVYLCGHTGSINRGCEAIIRSTVNILKQVGVENVSALTFNRADDMALGVHEVVNLLPYKRKPFIYRVISVMQRKLFHKDTIGAGYFYRTTLKQSDENSIYMNVGGDTYCYGTPYISYALNAYAERRNIPNIFWGCSVDEHALSDRAMQADLNKYSGIVVRESLSEEILKKVVHDKNKILKCCDPAFQLPIQKTILPENFMEGNTLGINLSPLVFADSNDENDVMYQNVYSLIDYIINQTDMNVCLIPHVYKIKENLQDSYVLGKIYRKYTHSGRVLLVNQELSCTQLKYIISKCRFFIGARTHSTIAAYSTEVPTIALSYSIKSRGIAKDLFGKEEGYVIEYKNIDSIDVLKNTLQNTLLKNEESIRLRYKEIMPEYKKSILNVAEKLMGFYNAK